MEQHCAFLSCFSCKHAALLPTQHLQAQLAWLGEIRQTWGVSKNTARSKPSFVHATWIITCMAVMEKFCRVAPSTSKTRTCIAVSEVGIENTNVKNVTWKLLENAWENTLSNLLALLSESCPFLNNPKPISQMAILASNIEMQLIRQKEQAAVAAKLVCTVCNYNQCLPHVWLSWPGHVLLKRVGIAEFWTPLHQKMCNHTVNHATVKWAKRLCLSAGEKNTCQWLAYLDISCIVSRGLFISHVRDTLCIQALLKKARITEGTNVSWCFLITTHGNWMHIFE